MNDVSELEKVIAQSAGDVKQFIERAEQKSASIGDRMFQIEQRLADGTHHADSTGTERKLSDEVLEHSNFRNFKSGGADKIRMVFERPMETKATVLSSSALVAGDRRAEITFPGQRQFTIRSLLPAVPTRSNLVEFTREDSFTNSAAPQVEGAAKGESTLTFSLQQAPVRTLAHWIPASKQVLDDAPALADRIDRRLRYGLEMVEESQILAGDGVGQNLLGLIPQSTAYNIALNVAGDTRIDRIRRAAYQVSLSEHAATGVVLNSFDWMNIELLKDLEF